METARVFVFVALSGASFASILEVEGCQPNRERLEDRAWIRNVHVEILLTDAAELHVYMVIVVFVDQLEVLDRRLVNTSVEIKHESLYLFIPLRRFIKEEHDPFCIVFFELILQCLVLVSRFPDALLACDFNIR